MSHHHCTEMMRLHSLLRIYVNVKQIHAVLAMNNGQRGAIPDDKQLKRPRSSSEYGTTITAHWINKFHSRQQSQYLDTNSFVMQFVKEHTS